MDKAKELERKIKRAKIQLEDLEKRKANLSKHGYWDMGYFAGKISILEEWLDEIKKE